MVRYRATNKTVLSTKYHVVWCPKYRRRVLTGRVEDRLKEILFVAIAWTVALSGFMQAVTGRSSRALCREFPRLRRLPCLRSSSWFVWTVGGAPLHVVRRYVENHA